MKELLLSYLCMALPYNLQVKAEGDNESYTLLSVYPNKDIVLISTDMSRVYATSKVKIDTVKPYLRTMSSMIEEEKREYFSLIGGQQPFDSDFSAYPEEHRFIYEFDVTNYVKWLISHHFDYIGLIKKGLAIEAPEGMYK